MSPRLELTTELIGIVKSSVVNKGNLARAVKMGVCVFICFTSVGGPASVCNSNVMAL